MRISITNPGKPAESLYIIKDLYLRDVRGKKSASNKSGKDRTTVTVEKLGKVSDLMEKMNLSHDEVITWARQRAKSLTDEEKAANAKITIDYFPNQRIEKNVPSSCNCGYLFLQSLYTQLRLDNTCRNIRNRYSFDFDLNSILSDLIFARILSPSSKLSSYSFCKSLLEPPKYDIHQVYRALSVIAKENDYIQSDVYRNSNFVISRNNRVLYYDCTNFFFEIEEADDFREYGKSKESRPNPIVQMGLFMDGDGIPLAFSTFRGASNEQPSMKPLEEKIIHNYGLDRFVVCTDGGLGSDSNRLFNNIEGRAFITTQSLKKLKKDERASALNSSGWKRLGDGCSVNIQEIKSDPEKYASHVYYKIMPYSSKKVPDQMMIVTYSPKYALYQCSIREKQIERAEKMIEKGSRKKEHGNQNDPARFIKKTAVTDEYEVADRTLYSLDEEKIESEMMYDGYYAICTDLVNDSVEEIIRVSEQRWEIEESFRIMKTEFQARPVYLSREDRIQAHFLICYLSLMIYRILEKKLKEKYTAEKIITTLRKMELHIIPGTGYQPSYTRTDLTDELHEIFGFNTDYQIMTKSSIRNIIKLTKQRQ